ncbi:putative copper export protein [Bosea sp. AK1]|uniref:CopD family protein n=1 Tax=Bosea sp. AK1 TaxID=2587160 RepID=UPI001153AF5B|nr:CopD family protein [Bosea sp. AK1]TQI72452.1 putative copper export protein [Bosea sp. AK1]
MDVLIGAALPAARWLHLAALLSGLGIEAFRLLSQGPLATTPGGRQLLRRLSSCSRFSVILALAGGALWFWLQGSAMLGRPLGSLESIAAVAETRFGEVLLSRAGLLALAGLLLRGDGVVRTGALLLMTIAALMQGLLGHGAATDFWTTAALGLHVLAAGLWLGALAPLLAVCRMLPAQAPLLARRFTPLGLACVTVLAATSILQVQALVGTLPGLLGTAYGRLAIAKIALFGGLLLLAAANRIRFVPAAAASGSTRALALSIAAETGLGLAIVAVAAALANEPPAIHEQPTWPFAFRPVPAPWNDAYLRDGLSRLLVPATIALALFALAAAFRKLRWPALLAGAAALTFAQIPPWRPYVVAAVPTSFQLSPTGYGARSIAAGRELFQRDCASCHGADARGRGPVAVAQSVWPPDLSAPLIAGRPGGELFWSIRHGSGPMPPAAQLDDAAIWSLVDFIRLRAGARIFSPPEMRWSGAARMPGFVARCADGTLVTPGNGAPLRVWIEGDEHGAGARVQVDDSARLCPVEDPEPLAAALAEVTASASAPALVLVDANGWLRRAFKTESSAAPDMVASELAEIRRSPLDGTALHH